MAILRTKTAVGIATALCLLTGGIATAEEAAGTKPAWTSTDRMVQLTGKVLCTNCTLDQAQKAHPDILPTRLYDVKHRKGQFVGVLEWISNPHWDEKLVVPQQVVLRSDDEMLRKLLDKKNQGKTLRLTGLLNQLGNLFVSQVDVVE